MCCSGDSWTGPDPPLQKLIKNFYPDSKLFYDKPLENHGEKPQLIEVNDRNNQIIKVTELINKLVNKEKIVPRDIAVIYDGSIKAPTKNDLSIVARMPKLPLQYVTPGLSVYIHTCILLYM